MEYETNLGAIYIEDLVYNNGNYIVIGGYRHATGMLESLLLVTSDDGNSWKLARSNKAGWLKSISCTGNICIAGGDSYIGSQAMELSLLVSKDNGLSWAKATALSKTFPFQIGKVGCVNNSCFAAGQSDETELSHPVMLISHDRGHSWSGVKNISGFPEFVYHIEYSSYSLS
jgi:photosystem II stability/assembly factor-like uncharacterized protein